MDRDFFFLAISFAYIGVLGLLGLLFYQVFKIKSELVRKFIHILTSNWIFLVLYGMHNPFMMLLGPFLFIFINTGFVYGGFGRYLGMENRKRDNGLIYYPLSVFVLILLYIMGFLGSESVVSGVLIMGWGDGLAAIIGTLVGRHSYKVFSKYKKSIEGTITMFAVSFIIVVLFSPCSWYFSLIIAVLATLLENITPLGFDNITVPIISAIALEFLCRL